MNPALRDAVEAALARRLGGEVKIARAVEAGGGCINNVEEIRAVDGRKFIVKSNASAPPGFFERESEGLAAILETGAIRAPEPLVLGGGEGVAPAFIVLECLEAAAQRPDYEETFGRRLADLHRREGERFGYSADNFIGATPQANAWSDSWTEFFRERRLLHQLHLLEKRGYATAELRSKLDRLLEKLDDIIGRHNPRPSLLHGDLWSGNIMTDEKGDPALIDPAVYYGDREADLAMTELFGRLDARFYAAYREAYPVPDGYDERRKVYDLYHLMNHLNIFGLSYMGGVMGVLRKYA